VNGNRATVRKKDLKIFISNGPLLRPRPHARPIRRRGVATAEAFAYAWEHWEREPGLPGALAALSRRQRLRLLAGTFDSCGNYSNSSEQPPKKDAPLVTIGLEFSVIVRLMMASRAGVATPL
jgi:hypothetical protein